MIWLDIIDPKYVLFFRNLIPKLGLLDEVLITTRKSKDYDECAKLLALFGIEAIHVGGYGGASLAGKFEARLNRQKNFLKLFKKIGTPKLFITGASADGTQTAYALGIPIVQFSDTPIKSDSFSIENITLLSRLTLPLSSLIFRPFIVPEVCYHALGIAKENIIAYDFIDVALWLKDLAPGRDFRETYHIPKDKPTILIREEEYKAHYVKEKLPIIYESITQLSAKIQANLVVMPRYDSSGLKKDFGKLKNVFILEEKLAPNEFYPFIDVLIGGGGTMNLEACYLGIPTISTRSLFLFHDRYLLDNALMSHCKTAWEVCEVVRDILDTLLDTQTKNRGAKIGSQAKIKAGEKMGTKIEMKNHAKARAKKLFEPKNADFDEIFQTIQARFYA
ncbi:DUF354 domain-containing protein [Helicobacter sp. 11S02596-1]|uniref:DUF354 domain-containing protein n=1 Tax=Helicobacter sp. 11S02596-1 TaxID=1476194 RepID=UPI000BA688DD|nr:DUF354 domain-containing protein [Helicobacter sp. 11S02596-1]PAF44782.1 hypothetical protein BJI48_01990 [Helicobacter sp. 11S02596-1]